MPPRAISPKIWYRPHSYNGIISAVQSRSGPEAPPSSRVPRNEAGRCAPNAFDGPFKPLDMRIPEEQYAPWANGSEPSAERACSSKHLGQRPWGASGCNSPPHAGHSIDSAIAIPPGPITFYL